MTAKQKAAREKFKKVVAEAAKLRKKNPSLTQAQAVKQAFAISYSKGGQTKKVGAVKKKAAPKKSVLKKAEPKKKAAPKKVASKRITDIHKDSKSHNVNIRVVSGIKSQNKKILKNISIAEDELYDVEIDIINSRLDLKNAILLKDKTLIKYEKDSLEFATKLKKELTEHIKELKKLL